MLKKLLPIVLATSIPAAFAYPSIDEIKNPWIDPSDIEYIEKVDADLDPEKAVPIAKIVEEEKTWKCPSCTENEKYVLKELQEKTSITDRNALATIMGNIKSESNFIPNICEGGARVSYYHCYSGGYGLIQWTSSNRYYGLGQFAKKYGCNPSGLECQTRYMINEPTFQKHIHEFEGNGQTVKWYMTTAYYWLGWGIKGYREHYAYNYIKKFVLS